VKVTEDLRKAAKAAKPDIAVLCTSSSLKRVMPQLEALMSCGLPVVSTTEELAYPAPRKPAACEAARSDGAQSEGRHSRTGVNPGFAMDALPIALTSVCEQVNRIEVRRVQDARKRRVPFQQKIGAGLTREQFEQQVKTGAVRHVGFTESIQMIGDAMGWTLTRITMTSVRGSRKKKCTANCSPSTRATSLASARRESATSATTEDTPAA
jgi:4-hydroxy-tetrahydrodipicolinate reductase